MCDWCSLGSPGGRMVYAGSLLASVAGAIPCHWEPLIGYALVVLYR